jgi:hypothetical protein
MIFDGETLFVKATRFFYHKILASVPSPDTHMAC